MYVENDETCSRGLYLNEDVFSGTNHVRRGKANLQTGKHHAYIGCDWETEVRSFQLRYSEASE